MSDTFQLPAKMDLTAAMKLVGDLRAIEGDIHLDASNVTHTGALCLQALAAAARHAVKNGHKFELHSVPDKMTEQLAVMGTSPEHLMEGAK